MAPALPLNAPFRVTLGYTPSTTDPLFVTFVATVVPGTPTGFNWSFGDGVFYNGSNASFASASHHFPPAGGTFTVTVTAHEGLTSNSTSLIITLQPPPLSVDVSATPTSGGAPLTVTFQATVSGGTGTYRSFTWSFGNGQGGVGSPVRVTYSQAGHYVVFVNATDSAGTSVLAETNVTVSDGGASTSPPFLGPRDVALLGAGAAIGLAVGALAMFAGQRRAARRGAVVPHEAPALADAAPAPAPTPTPPPEPIAPPGALAAKVVPPMAPPVRARPSTEVLRISQRVVLHLSVQGVLGPHDVAPLGFTQPGISQSLGVRQNALTNVLRRLVAAGVVVEDVRHVQGQPRRLKVYQLTPRGEALARELRHPRAAGRSSTEDREA